MFAIRKGTLYTGNTPVRQIPSPNTSGPFRHSPRFIVMHFTAGGAAENSAAWLANPRAGASAHLVIGRDGTTIQCVNLEMRAWHAGRSRWQGLSGLNDHAIGIELANWGPLARSGDNWVTPRGEQVPCIEAAHRNGGPVRGWETFPERQIKAAIAIAHALTAYHPISGILGHDEIAPERKLDPGPAFDMASFRKAVLGGPQALVSAEHLP